jgi:hypothetical protein
VINEEKGEGTKVDLEVLKVGLGVLFWVGGTNEGPKDGIIEGIWVV